MLLTVETKMKTSYMLLNETAFHVTGVCSQFINQCVACAYGYTDPCKCVKVYLCDSWGFLVGGACSLRKTTVDYSLWKFFSTADAS